VENPYCRYFCGFDYLQHQLPLDPSSLTRWRRRIGAERMEMLLKATIAAAVRGGTVDPKSFGRVNVDTTVQEKAIAKPLDSRLYHRGREILVRLAQRHGLPLRQSYERLGKRALRLVHRYGQARQNRRMPREIGRLKRFLGRVDRDVRRKLVSRPDLADRFAEPLALIARLLAQQRTDKRKLYALHAPEVECLSKGKIGKRYEFGVKVALATTNREALVVAMQALPGNPHDGHTLAPTLTQVERLTGTSPARCFVDRGYRGHGLRDTMTVVMAGQRRGLPVTLRRRSAIEATIGHMKADGRLGRNYLKGTAGDAKALLLAERASAAELAGQNEQLRAILKELQRALFGRRTERTADPDQLQLPLEDLEQALAQSEAEAGEERRNAASVAQAVDAGVIFPRSAV
jgi:transposase, IS5 family